MTLADRIIIMKDGYIEQIGSPIEVFSKPANVFVATFIGSPPMNIFSAEIINSNNQTKIKLDENIYFDCSDEQKNKLKNKTQYFWEYELKILCQSIKLKIQNFGLSKKI